MKRLQTIMLSAAAFAAASAAQAQSIKININPVPYQSALFVAAARGFDQKNGFKLELVKLAAGAQNTPALVNGTLNFSSCTLDNIANFTAQGKSVVAIYKLVERPTLDLVVANKAIPAGLSASSPIEERMKALRGLRYGISEAGGPSDVFIRALLLDAGLTPGKDAEIIRMGSIGGLFAGLKSGQIDGYVLSPPSPQQAEAAGVGRVLIKISGGEVASLAKFPSVALCTMADTIAKNPDMVQKFVTAIQQANDWMRANKDETVTIGQKLFPNVPVASWREAVELSLPAVSTDGRFDQAEVLKAFEVYKNAGATELIPDTKEGTTWTNRFIPSK
jgi:NitT/TauT family transport system substrate-binding protein